MKETEGQGLMFRFSIERLLYVKLYCATYLAGLYICFWLYSWSKIINRSNHLLLQIFHCFETFRKARTMRLLQSTQTSEFNATWRVTILLTTQPANRNQEGAKYKKEEIAVFFR